jgi:glutamate-5-semialdehyde dehydrogenase
MYQGVLDVMNLPDPLGRVTYATKMDHHLEWKRVSCALGVLVIFEVKSEVVVNITASHSSQVPLLSPLLIQGMPQF